MGSHVVRPLRRDDEVELYRLLMSERDDLNRRVTEIVPLFHELYDDAHTLVAVEGERVIGFVALRRGTRSSQHVAHLRIHVDRDHRSNGIGNKLLRRSLFWADRRGIERIVATPYVSHRNVAKLGFFRRHGFELDGIAAKFARCLNGSYTAAALMARVR